MRSLVYISLAVTAVLPALAGATHCNADNCLRALENEHYSSSASSLCSEWLATTVLIPSSVPPFLTMCGTKPCTLVARVSSACDCLLGSKTSSASSSSPTSSASRSSSSSSPTSSASSSSASSSPTSSTSSSSSSTTSSGPISPTGTGCPTQIATISVTVITTLTTTLEITSVTSIEETSEFITTATVLSTLCLGTPTISVSVSTTTTTVTITQVPSSFCSRFTMQADACWLSQYTSAYALFGPGCFGLGYGAAFTTSCICGEPLTSFANDLATLPAVEFPCSATASVTGPLLLDLADTCQCLGVGPSCDFYLAARPSCGAQAIVLAGEFYPGADCFGAGVAGPFYSSCVCAQPPASLTAAAYEQGTECHSGEVAAALEAQAAYCACASVASS